MSDLSPIHQAFDALAPRLGMQPITVAVIGMLIGIGVVGPLAGVLLLRIIRRAADDDRRLTYSLLVGGALGVLALVPWCAGMPSAALVPAALAWGQLLHLLGDVVIMWNMAPLRFAKVHIMLVTCEYDAVHPQHSGAHHIPRNIHDQRRAVALACFDERCPGLAAGSGAL